MNRKLFFYLFLAGLLTWLLPDGPDFRRETGQMDLVSSSFALEKVKLGTATKTGVIFYPHVLTAEQRGFWKDNGLEVEWVPLAGAATVMRALAGGVLNLGLSGAETPIGAAAKGVPVIIVMEYISEAPYCLWVRMDSPYRQVRDLKGARIGATTLGGTTHAFGRVITRAYGIEKDVRFVGAGGNVPAMAAMKAGALDALVSGLSACVRVKVRGEGRELASVTDYLPKPYLDTVVFGRRDFTRANPDTVKKVIRAMLQATDFMRRNPRWTMDMMKGFQGLSEEEAKLIYERLNFNSTGRIDRKGVENARRFYIEYGLLTEKAPPVDELFTNEYLPS